MKLPFQMNFVLCMVTCTHWCFKYSTSFTKSTGRKFAIFFEPRGQNTQWTSSLVRRQYSVICWNVSKTKSFWRVKSFTFQILINYPSYNVISEARRIRQRVRRFHFLMTTCYLIPNSSDFAVFLRNFMLLFLPAKKTHLMRVPSDCYAACWGDWTTHIFLW